MTAELDLARQWVHKAENDLLNADNNLRAENIPFDTVCFHCQQSAEKLLKAALIANNITPSRTHDLMILLKSLLKIDSTATVLREPLANLIPYAVEIHYPDDWFMPSLEDAQEARDMVAQVLEWTHRVFPRLFPNG